MELIVYMSMFEKKRIMTIKFQCINAVVYPVCIMLLICIRS